MSGHRPIQIEGQYPDILTATGRTAKCKRVRCLRMRRLFGAASLPDSFGACCASGEFAPVNLNQQPFLALSVLEVREIYGHHS
jgi:hypothetical protein